MASEEVEGKLKRKASGKVEGKLVEGRMASGEVEREQRVGKEREDV